MVIFAAEDIGNAEPRALSVAVDALRAFELVGLPEGVLPMTQAAVFLATCPKSNSTLTTYSKARAAVLERGPLQVPLKLRNAPTPLMKSMGYSGGYRYPHNFSGNYVPEEYLPDELRGQRYYEPSQSGEEKEIGERLAKWREELEKQRAEEAERGEAEEAAGRKLSP
jgi:putative ATPase